MPKPLGTLRIEYGALPMLKGKQLREGAPSRVLLIAGQAERMLILAPDSSRGVDGGDGEVVP
jgi:hypothetical protein